MIEAAYGKPGWFRVDHTTGAPLVREFSRLECSGVRYMLPGVKIHDALALLVHRSHLPLLDDPKALTLLAPSAPDWPTRTARFAELGIVLRTTQHQAIDFIADRDGTLLGDDMRLGKTLTAVASHDPRLGKLVIVAPLSTRAVWLNWIKKVFPGTPIGICVGKGYKADVFDQPIVLGHYDIIHKWQTIQGIGTLVLDEAHALTNPDSKRSQAALILARFAKRVIALTGTPIWRLPSDLWSVIGMVAPGAWGNYYDFAERYGAPKPTAYGKVYEGLSNGEELHRRLSDVMLRRRWVDCFDDLPPITRSVLVAEVSQAESNKLDILAAKLKSDRTNTAGHFASYRRQVSRIKLGVVCREAMRVMANGSPVVIWTWHKDYAENVARDLQNRINATNGTDHAYVIHGDIPPGERDAIMTAWRRDPSSALVATLAVAGAGIDLSHAPGAIFGEIDYTPAIIGQGEMRTYDPKRAMWILFVVANHIVDQRITRALVHKLGAADPLGVGAAVDSIDALRDAVLGPDQVGDLDRLLADLIASAE